MGVLTNATARLHDAADNTPPQTITQQLRASLQTGGAAGLANSSTNQTQLNALGWTGAGAYYLEFARLNGQTLSILSAVPQITPPSYDGFGPSLSSDLAPLVQSSQAFHDHAVELCHDTGRLECARRPRRPLLRARRLARTAQASSTRSSAGLHLSDYVLQLFQSAIAPTGNQVDGSVLRPDGPW